MDRRAELSILAIMWSLFGIAWLQEKKRLTVSRLATKLRRII